MKKLTVSILVFLFLLCLISCGDDEDNANSDSANSDTSDSADSGSADTGDSHDGTSDTSSDSGNTDTGTSDSESEEEEEDEMDCVKICGPDDQDEDGDGIPNGEEGCDDNDGDGIPECKDTDSDNDNFSDKEECPSLPCKDTDGDGIADYLDKDSDNDGLIDREEKKYNTDPYNKDTDGDGDDDMAEIAFETDPLDPESHVPAGNIYVVLPYNANWNASRTWEFDTDISKIDVAFMLDLSTSMDAEQQNLKDKIKTDVVEKVATLNEGTLDAAYAFVHFMDFDKDMDKVYKVDTLVTKDIDELKNAIDSTPQTYGGTECDWLVLYAATISEDIIGQCSTPPSVSWMPVDAEKAQCNIPLPDCTGRVGNRAGLCFRDKAMPILILITDEAPTDTYMPPENKEASELAIKTMIQQNAKFIGIDSSGTKGTKQITNFFETVSKATKTQWTTTLPDGTQEAHYFNFAVGTDAVAADGKPMSEKIGEAIESLTSFVQMDVWVEGAATDICNGENISKFIIGGIPIKAEPPEGAGLDTAGWKFSEVKPGTVVTFDVQFHNDFCPNLTSTSILYNAEAMVMGEGAYLSKKAVQIIVPPSDVK